MDNLSTPTAPNRPPLGRALLKALGFGLLMALPLTLIFYYGSSSFIYYFRLTYNMGLDGLLLGLALIVYGFFGNAVIMILTTFITLERSRRPFLHAIIIGLIINGLYIIGGWGYNLYTHQGQLSVLAEQRNNDRYVDAQGLSDCAKLTDIRHWRVCINNKVITAYDKTACDAQAAQFASQPDKPTGECTVEYALGSGSTRLCAEVPILGNAYANQRLCVYDTIQKSWEKNNRKTPLAIVEGCSALSDPIEKQFCYVASLRQLSVGDAVATIACQNIDPHLWFKEVDPGDSDIQNLKNVCNITISTT